MNSFFDHLATVVEDREDRVHKILTEAVRDRFRFESSEGALQRSAEEYLAVLVLRLVGGLRQHVDETLYLVLDGRGDTGVVPHGAFFDESADSGVCSDAHVGAVVC